MPKEVSKYNATDLFRFWSTEYKKNYGMAYSPVISAMYDTKRFKDLLEDNSVFVILNAIKISIDRGCIGPKFFQEDFEKYKARAYDQRLHFFVNDRGGKEQKKLWQRYRMLSDFWVGDAHTFSEQKKIIDKLNLWVENFEL